jgi:hypothetical protein
MKRNPQRFVKSKAPSAADSGQPARCMANADDADGGSVDPVDRDIRPGSDDKFPRSRQYTGPAYIRGRCKATDLFVDSFSDTRGSIRLVCGDEVDQIIQIGSSPWRPENLHADFAKR